MSGFPRGAYPRDKIDFYTLIAPFYDAFVGPFLRAARKDITREAAAGGCRRVLEVACGTGEQARMFAKEGLAVTGVDLSGAMLGVAAARDRPPVSFVLGNAEKLPFEPESFDCVSVSLALHEMAYDSAIRVGLEMLRVLAPDGRLIVFDHAAGQNVRSALAVGVLGLLERVAGRAHFSNFIRFTRMGGVERFLESFPLKIVAGETYFLGALKLVVARKDR
jgi:demethylmenaquinone methyltransferase/2-methoxy-6-polyprenyl-1,4-benzoquinol methylase